jgi:hypothetical protein
MEFLLARRSLPKRADMGLLFFEYRGKPGSHFARRRRKAVDPPVRDLAMTVPAAMVAGGVIMHADVPERPGVATATVVFDDGNGPVGKTDDLRFQAKRENRRMVYPVPGLEGVGVEKALMRDVTVVAHRHVAMAGTLPGRVRGMHHVTVGATLRGVAQVRRHSRDPGNDQSQPDKNSENGETGQPPSRVDEPEGEYRA